MNGYISVYSHNGYQAIKQTKETTIIDAYKNMNDKYVHYLNYDNGFTVHTYGKMYYIVYFKYIQFVNYASMKLLKRENKNQNRP